MLLPSENDDMKNDFPTNTFETICTNSKTKTTSETDPRSKINHFNETAAVMPIVIAPKYTESSRGDLTGFLNLTIDKAPTIPKDKAIFPEITLVIINVIGGINKAVKVK